MKHLSARRVPRVGVLAAWQVYEGTTVDGYLHMLFGGIRSAARDRGCDLLLGCGVAPPIPRRLVMPAWPVPMSDSLFVPVGPWNTDGLLIVPNGLSSERLSYVQDLVADGHPVVYAGAPELAPTVAVDNAHGIDQAVEHLVAHGHRKIAFIAGPLNQPGDGLERLMAYRTAQQRLGLEADPRLIAYADQADDIDSGRQAMYRILSSAVSFSALLTYNDWFAIGAMQSLKSASLETPRDVAVIGFDDRLHARVQSPPLTTIRHPTFELGHQSLVALLDLMDGKWDGKTPIRIPTRLIVRQSCGCRPGSALVSSRAMAPTDGQWTSATQTAPSTLPRAMAEATAAEARRYGFDDLEAAAGRLLAALSSDIEQKSTSLFNQVFADALQGTLARDEDVYIWHAAISALENEAARDPALSKFTLPMARTLLNQAHLTISEQSRRQSTGRLIQQMEIAERLGLMTSQLLAVLDAEQIAAILAEHLPRVGIRHLAAALFEPQEDDAFASSSLVAGCGLDWAGATRRFVTRHFPLPDLYASVEPLCLAILPLIIQGQNVGFVAFDGSDLEPCAVIMRNLAAALQGSQLYHDAAEGRRLAEEANRLKTRFLSTVSHELRTPLNVIVGLSKLMLNEQVQGTRPAPQDLERIYASAQHLGFLIRDVLDLASSDAGQLRLTCERLDLAAALGAIVPTGEQLARDKGLDWCAQIPDSTPPVWGDRTRLRQVALNFISNAVKFTPQGVVKLAIEADASRVTVSVSDTGLGVPPHEQGDIFDEFRQSERTASRGYGGLGLGLAISRHLINLHGGEIGVRSSGVEGEGATFYFSLPVMVVTQPAEPEVAALPSSQAALVLTDQPETGERLRTYLQQEGFPVVTQIIAPQADWLAQVRQAAPAAVLLDRRLATDRTWDIVQRLKQDSALQDMPILFYTLAPEGNTGSLLELDYRTKPLQPQQLVQMLRPSGRDKGKTILIVDDDPDALDLHTRLVKQQLPDCQVLQARHGREAIAALERTRPDLILLDLMMPELDGFGVLETLQERETTRDIPVVVLTARALNEADMARLSRGVVSVLEKGVLSVDETLARVAGVLGHVDRLGSATRRLVRKAMAYLHEHYAEPLTREQVANYVGASESHLANCFHLELGLSPMTYLNRFRIRQARALLETGELNVTEVAFSVGFCDSAYFGRVFQREVGVSPGAYRRGHRPQ